MVCPLGLKVNAVPFKSMWAFIDFAMQSAAQCVVELAVFGTSACILQVGCMTK